MRIIALVLANLLIAGCSNFSPAPPTEDEGPVSFLTGKPGGLKLSDLGDLNKSGNGDLPVNAILWRASLEIVSLLPIADVDTFGGTIVTEWYKLNKTSDERIKMTAFVLDRELRADGIRVVVYVQKRAGNSWQDSGTDGEMGKQIEELILTRAREIRASGYVEMTN